MARVIVSMGRSYVDMMGGHAGIGWYPLQLRKSWRRGSWTGAVASSCLMGFRLILRGVVCVSSMTGLSSRIISRSDSMGNLGTILQMMIRSLKH